MWKLFPLQQTTDLDVIGKARLGCGVWQARSSATVDMAIPSSAAGYCNPLDSKSACLHGHSEASTWRVRRASAVRTYAVQNGKTYTGSSSNEGWARVDH